MTSTVTRDNVNIHLYGTNTIMYYILLYIIHCYATSNDHKTFSVDFHRTDLTSIPDEIYMRGHSHRDNTLQNNSLTKPQP